MQTQKQTPARAGGPCLEKQTRANLSTIRSALLTLVAWFRALFGWAA